MRRLLLAAFLLSTAGFLCAQPTPWCISVTDVCCNDNETTGTYALGSGANDYVNTFYIHYDTGSKNDKVSIRFTVDGGGTIWSLDNLCGCGDISRNYQIRGPHQLEFHVKCHYCSMPPCENGSATVWIWTPQTVACAPKCGDPTE
jgi:hypothetical protein